jgi:sacsin
VFEEEDWDGITMVRKSNKHDNPLKVGKFGIGFKSVFHVTGIFKDNEIFQIKLTS